MKNGTLARVVCGWTGFSSVASAAILTVTTTNNVSPGTAVSLKQALGQLHDGDTVRFNIPGPGPFYLATPPGGYPMITNNNITIDGYSQPGAVPNSHPILAPNNAKLAIVLDSRNGNFTSMNYEPDNTHAGYGASEYAVLGIFRGTNVAIQGLSILGKVPAAGDNSNYLISFACDESGTPTGGRVSGCWLGVAPDGVTLSGAKNGITAFRHEDVNGQNPVVIDNLMVGVAPGATNAPAQFNVLVQFADPIIIEGNGTRISGNFIGVLPDGLHDYNVALDPAYTADFQFQGALELGRGNNNTVIGTDGDGVNDANERNVFGGTLPASMNGYDHTIEFYGNDPGTNIVIAGNYIGIGIDGKTLFTNGVPAVNGSGNASQYRIGSDFDGTSDAAEANWIFNNWPPGVFPAANLAQAPTALNFFDELSAGSLISARGNVLINNFPYPESPDKGSGAVTNYYSQVLLDPTQGIAPTLATNTNNVRISGTYPLADTNVYPYTIIDFYLADPLGIATGQATGLPEFTNGFVLGAAYLGSLDVASTNNLDPTPGQFTLDISRFPIPAGGALTATANYSATKPGTHNAVVMTSAFANPVVVGRMAAGSLKLTKITAQAGGVALDWTGGAAPYTVQKKNALTDTQWQEVVTVSGQHAVVAAPGASGFYRVATGISGAPTSTLPVIRAATSVAR